MPINAVGKKHKLMSIMTLATQLVTICSLPTKGPKLMHFSVAYK